MSAADPNDRHIPALDGLRGLAVIAVILCHANHATGGPFTAGRVAGPLATVFGWGWVGVDLFFVLSGFLITSILYSGKGGEGFFRNFYARRVLRIMPLYFGFLLFVILLSRLGCPFCPWVSGDEALSLGLFYYNFRVVETQRFIGSLHAFWSLSVEEHFYLLWPFVVWSLPRRALIRLCLAGAAASFVLRLAVIASGAWPLSAFFLTPCRLDGLLAGSWVALVRRDPADWARLQQWAGRVTLGAGCLLLGIALGQRHFLPDVDFGRGHDAAVDSILVLTVGIAALAVFFSGLIALAVGGAEESRLRRFLEGRGLRTVGKYSYGVYVFHPLIMTATGTLLSPSAHLPIFVAKPTVAVWALAASLVAAWLSYHLYEKHFLRLKCYFEYREPARAPALYPSQPASYRNA